MAGHLIVGGDGLIGGALFEFLNRRSIAVRRTSRRAQTPGAFAFDLAAPDSSVAGVPEMARLVGDAPLIVYLAAAVSGYAQCEADPAGTRRVNVVNLTRIAGEFVRRGAFVVFPSSTAVFSGSRPVNAEADATDPVSEYGRQKAEAERELCALAARATGGGGVAIARLTKVVAPGAGIIATWLSDLRAGRPIEAAQDLRFAPLSLAYAVRNLVHLGMLRRSGTFHLSGASDMAYLEFARLLAVRLGAAPEQVVPVAIRDRVSGDALAQPGVLDMRETTAQTGIRPQAAGEVFEDLATGAGDRS